MNEKTAPFKSIKKATDKYRLYWTNPQNGTTKMVSGVGMGTEPFEILYTIDKRPYVIIKRNGNTRGTAQPRLFLINYKTGAVVPEMPFGAHEILIDEKTHNIYFKSFNSAGADSTKYSWCIPYGGISLMVLNVPSRRAQTSTVINTQTEPICVVPLVFEIKPQKTKTTDSNTPTTKRKRGRPLGSKNKNKKISVAPVQQSTLTAPVKKKRGRPLGSKNKPKSTTLAAPAAPKHTAQRKSVGRSLYGTYYDVYVNGKRIATKRLDAELKTFMNDRILTVRHTMPSAILPTYDIVLPNLHLWHTNAKNKYSNTQATPCDLAETDKGLQIKLTNGATTTIKDSALNQMPDIPFIIITDECHER